MSDRSACGHEHGHHQAEAEHEAARDHARRQRGVPGYAGVGAGALQEAAAVVVQGRLQELQEDAGLVFGPGFANCVEPVQEAVVDLHHPPVREGGLDHPARGHLIDGEQFADLVTRPGDRTLQFRLLGVEAVVLLRAGGIEAGHIVDAPLQRPSGRPAAWRR